MSRNQQYLAFIIGALVLTYFALSGSKIPTESPPSRPGIGAQMDGVLLEVGVIPVESASYYGKVKGFGEALPRDKLSLKAEVSGRVLSLPDNFATGITVRKGDLLALVDSTDYKYELAVARSSVVAAELSLTEEQRLARQARAEWQSSGLEGEPDPLVLRTLQLESAEASLEQAQRRVDRANRDLQNTQITAPFDALIISRDVQPGSYLQVGSQLGVLYGVERLEVSVPLSADQWSIFGDSGNIALDSVIASLASVEDNKRWSGRVVRVEQHVNTESRQRSLVVAVENPLIQDTPLYPGTYLEVTIQGKQFENLWRVPETSITPQGELWYVDTGHQLRRYKPRIVFRADGYAYVKALAGESRSRIVSRPLTSYLAGVKVQPVQEAL
ncbi:efflux RND transporter periplasmic adaptor subunit [Parahaliea maris]|nr:efflux RND transporter periplasmic adaptor subunit [Parahaliea maris]